MEIQPYLFLDGRCEEAIAFYREALGAEVAMMMRASECPVPSNDPAMTGNKIMHAAVRVGEAMILMSDGRSQSGPGFQGFSLAITAKDKAEAERLFAALANGGQVRMPMAETFFSPAFGMLADRFGVGWMVLVRA